MRDQATREGVFWDFLAGRGPGSGEWAPTTDLHVQFLAAASPGRLVGRRPIAAGGVPVDVG